MSEKIIYLIIVAIAVASFLLGVSVTIWAD